MFSERENQELWKQCDWDFHHALISACGSDVLLSTHALIYDRYLRYQMIAVVFRGVIAAREHQELLDSALKRDWQRAPSLMTAHVQGCVEHALAEDNAGIFGGVAKAPALPNPDKPQRKAASPAAPKRRRR